MTRWSSLVLVSMVALVSCGEGASESAEGGDVGATAETPEPSGSASASANSGDPCRLISDQEMSDLLPNPVAGQPVNIQTCDYGPVDLALGRVDVEVFVQDIEAIGCEMYFDVGGFADEEPLSWAGAVAYWKDAPAQLGLCVDERLAVAITLYDPDKTTGGQVTARAIGELVLSRL